MDWIQVCADADRLSEEVGGQVLEELAAAVRELVPQASSFIILSERGGPMLTDAVVNDTLVDLLEGKGPEVHRAVEVLVFLVVGVHPRFRRGGRCYQVSLHDLSVHDWDIDLDVEEARLRA